MKKLIACTLIAGLAVGSAWAQGDLRAARAMVGKQCAAEIQQYCPNVPRVKGMTAKCLERNRASLSKRCKDALDAAIAIFRQNNM